MSNSLPPKVATPGWNDPPQVPYNSSKPQGTTSGRGKLNKRVAFPIQTTPSPVQPQLSIPPVITPEVNKSPETTETLEWTPEGLEMSHEKCSRVIKNFSVCLDRSSCDRDMKYDLKMRIKCFEAQWKENKLPEDLRETVLKLSEALVDRNNEEAENLLAYAAENYCKITSSWMPVVRHILTKVGPDTEEHKEI